MDQYRRGELVFDVIDEGPADGPVVRLVAWVLAVQHELEHRYRTPHRSGVSVLGTQPAGFLSRRAADSPPGLPLA